MRRVKIRIELQGPLEWGDGSAVVAGLHQLFTQVEKGLCQIWIGLCRLAELCDGNVKMSLLVGLNARLHVLSALGRNTLQGQPEKYECVYHE